MVPTSNKNSRSFKEERGIQVHSLPTFDKILCTLYASYLVSACLYIPFPRRPVDKTVILTSNSLILLYRHPPHSSCMASMYNEQHDASRVGHGDNA